MKIKLSQIIDNSLSIQGDKEKGIEAKKSPFEALLETNLPIKVSFKIRRLVDKLNPILKSYEEKRNELVTEFGEKQEDGTFSVKDPEKLKQFFAKHNELLEVEEEVDFEPISVNDLGEAKIEPKNMVNFVFVE